MKNKDTIEKVTIFLVVQDVEKLRDIRILFNKI